MIQNKLLFAPLFFLAFFVIATEAKASDPYFAFEDGSFNMLSPENQTWQQKFENLGDYGESWFYVVQNDDGGVLFLLMSVTNLGLRTFTGIVSVQWYPATGSSQSFYREVNRRHISASDTSMDIRIGPARTWGGGDRYQVKIDDPEIKLDLDLSGGVKGYQFGGGKAEFYADRSAEWALGFNKPRGNAAGSIEIGGQKSEIKGRGYHDHGWMTIKMPTLAQRWFTLRLFHDEYSIVLHKIYLQDRFGGGTIDLGIVAKGDAIVGTTRGFGYRPQSWRRCPSSSYRIPTEIDISIRSGGYTILGKAVESRYLESIDVLGQLSRPVRAVIRAFYSSPYMHRFISDYELEITGPDGGKETISGQAIMEANYY